MRKKSLECRNVLLVVSLALAVFKANAQAGIPPLVSALPEEAPSSLFSTTIGDADVELFIQGFWEASIQSLGTLSFGGSSAATFNATPFLFTQRPDLYLLLVFRRQWWLEASVADDIERATWAIGYSGEEDDFLKFARLGNTGILMPDYPYLAFGAPTGAFGAVVSGRDESKGTAFDAMVRWDGLSWRSRSFSGLAETVETLVRPGEYLRGRRFVLPDEGLSSIALFDHTSSGKRLLQVDEYSVSLAKGFVELKAEPRGVLSVVYTVEGEEPKPELGLYQRPGTNVVSGIDPEKIAPTIEARNLYALSDSPARRELFVRNLSTGQPDLGFEVRQVGPGLMEVVKAGTVGPRPPEPPGSWHDSDYRRPFSTEAIGPDGQDWIYDEAPEGSQLPLYPPTEGYAIIARSIETVDAIVLGTAAVPGTITVFRDGAQTEAYDYDSASGKLELLPPPRAGESILVRYAVTSADRSDGALVFAAGTRFPWLGLDWALALGGRWSLPGVAYAAGGELKPAWTGLALGVERREAHYGFGAKALAKYSRASANDLYRLAGMDDASGFQSPFRPVPEESNNFEISSVADSGLASAFPELMGKIHTRNELNKVLSIKAKKDVTDGAIELLRYIEPAPLASFGRLSFFIKIEEKDVPLAEATVLSLQVGSGEGGAGGLTVALPVHELSPGWHKVEVDLNPVHSAVRVFSPGGQSLELSNSPTTNFAAVSTVSEVRLFITGMSEGTLFIDEIILEEAEDGLSAIFALDFSLGKAASARPPYLQVDLTGLVDENLALGGSMRAGWVLGPSEWTMSLAPTWSEDYVSTSFGYTLAIPSRASATRLVDQYTQDIATGSFARNISGGVGVEKLRMGFEAGTSETRNRFSQTWKGSAAWDTLARFGVELGLAVPETVAGNLDPADVWLESWQLFLPARESSASSRRLSLNASAAESRFAVDYRQEYSAPGSIATNAGFRARIPFSIGVMNYEPFLDRRFKITESATVVDFVEDFSFALARAGAIHKPFTALPLVDLFNEELGRQFFGSITDSNTASYSTGAGVSARRPIGYGLLDLLVPNTLELLWTRTFETALDSQLEYYDFRLKTTTAAVNLFGYGGAKPLMENFAYDEYSSDIDTSARYHLVDGTLLPALAARHAASIETRQGSTLTASSRFSWKQTRTGSQASETLSLSLGTKPDRSWLGDLVTVILTRRSEGVESSSDEERPNSVAGWFDSIVVESAVLRDSFDASLTSSGQSFPGSSSLKATFAYATRMIIPGSLSVGFKSAINPGIQFRTEGWIWALGYEFALEGRVSF
jgi:hypothetical protein